MQAEGARGWLKTTGRIAVAIVIGGTSFGAGWITAVTRMDIQSQYPPGRTVLRQMSGHGEPVPAAKIIKPPTNALNFPENGAVSWHVSLGVGLKYGFVRVEEGSKGLNRLVDFYPIGATSGQPYVTLAVLAGRNADLALPSGGYMVRVRNFAPGSAYNGSPTGPSPQTAIFSVEGGDLVPWVLKLTDAQQVLSAREAGHSRADELVVHSKGEDGNYASALGKAKAEAARTEATPAAASGPETNPT